MGGISPRKTKFDLHSKESSSSLEQYMSDDMRTELKEFRNELTEKPVAQMKKFQLKSNDHEGTIQALTSKERVSSDKIHQYAKDDLAFNLDNLNIEVINENEENEDESDDSRPASVIITKKPSKMPSKLPTPSQE